MKILITHTDLDGLGSAIISIADNLFDRIYCWNNGFVDHSVLKGNQIVVTDLSLDIPNATIYDHHVASKSIRNAICDLNRCGTRIFYEEYVQNHNPSRDRFVHLIDIFDRWQEKNKDFKEAMDLSRICEYMCGRDSTLIYDRKLINSCYSKFISQMLIGILKPFKLSPEQMKIANNVRTEEDKAYNMAMETICQRVDSRKHKFAICVMRDYISQNANRYLNEHPEVTYILVLSATNRRKLSARGRDGFDLNTLKGLAGHPKAAGGLYSPDFLSRLEDGYVKELGYK